MTGETALGLHVDAARRVPAVALRNVLDVGQQAAETAQFADNA